ncbi:hypothetical protein HETIRDRAFT_412435 [Heterobasidion irregulare TC 32-1]|uniref:Uncharacterized protein n=1 Tax=Heterobasidion irregulare (strain TC 32-1) TaxID=747525 RepID=W4JNU0_HETIT|nr:uncharacterized protein HETIRDRAFT_412435 [Heterobasidion irregulare TC 32-1]ETW75208.1 hypothetical protein HETIRDRAFT_412435 [Heterobasidion irregulare TC 32-1]
MYMCVCKPWHASVSASARTYSQYRYDDREAKKEKASKPPPFETSSEPPREAATSNHTNNPTIQRPKIETTNASSH